MTPASEPSGQEEHPLKGEIPYHTPCGLPAELCVCPDAEMIFDDVEFARRDGKALEDESQDGTVYVDLNVPGSEERARELVAGGMKVREFSIQTEEIECPVCEWGKETDVTFNFEHDERPLPRTIPCFECGFHISLSPELLRLMEDLSEAWS